MTITIFLADDHTVLRDSLRYLLDAQSEFEVVGVAANGREAVTQVIELRPDVVIMDIAMPEMTGIEASRQMNQEYPAGKIIILSMHRTPEHISRALQAGARGYLLKESASSDLIEAVRSVYSGKRYLCQEVADLALDYYVDLHRGEVIQNSAEQLTSREREIVQLLVQGQSSVDIASELCLSPRTVDTYRGRIMQKLNLPHLPALVKFAIRHGLASLD